MKTFEDFLNEVAKKNGYSSHIIAIAKKGYNPTEWYIEAAELYAQQYKDEIDHLKGQVFQFQGMLRIAEEEIRKYRQQ